MVARSNAGEPPITGQTRDNTGVPARRRRSRLSKPKGADRPLGRLNCLSKGHTVYRTPRMSCKTKIWRFQPYASDQFYGGALGLSAVGGSYPVMSDTAQRCHYSIDCRNFSGSPALPPG